MVVVVVGTRKNDMDMYMDTGSCDGGNLLALLLFLRPDDDDVDVDDDVDDSAFLLRPTR